jgi:hypothetical protein
MSETSVPPPPNEVHELAQACVGFVLQELAFTLDYTAETVPVLDHYLRGKLREAGPAADLVTASAGAYFGEVVRRRLPGARWHSPAGDYRAWRLEFEPFFLWFNPLGAAFEAAGGEASDGWNAHFQVLDEARVEIQRALAAAPEVSEEDYFTLAIRLEVIEQVADVLAGLESKQQKQRHFGPDVYRAAAGDNLEDDDPGLRS